MSRVPDELDRPAVDREWEGARDQPEPARADEALGRGDREVTVGHERERREERRDARGKTLAERAAWEFVERPPEARRLELVAVLPGAILGPVLGPDFSVSGEIVKKILGHEFPGGLDLGWALADVRDVTAVHVAAMTAPGVVGKRIIVATEHVPMGEVARILDAEFGQRGFRIPTGRLPGWVLRVVALWDPAAAMTVRELGKRQDVSSARARDLFGWAPRSVERMVIDMAESMIACGVVKERPRRVPAL